MHHGADFADDAEVVAFGAFEHGVVVAVVGDDLDSVHGTLEALDEPVPLVDDCVDAVASVVAVGVAYNNVAVKEGGLHRVAANP